MKSFHKSKLTQDLVINVPKKDFLHLSDNRPLKFSTSEL